MATVTVAPTRVASESASQCTTSAPTATDCDLTKEIILAAYRQDAKKVKEVLTRCEAGATAGMSLSRSAAVELLGEEVYLGSHSWSTQEGFPVMYFAAKWGGTEVTKLLLESGAAVAPATTLGVQPLHMAAQEGQVDVARLLVAHGAPCDATDRAGWSAFHYAANHRWATWERGIEGQLAVLRLLKECGARVDAEDGEGYTAVHSAAQSGKTEIVSLLRELGAKPDATTVRGVMPIHVAAEGGRAAVVEELLDWCPALLEAEDSRGHRPVDHASYHGHAAVVETLIRHGADCANPSPASCERNAAYTAAAAAANGGDQNGEPQRARGTTPLHLAARSNAFDVVAALLAGGADPTRLDSHGWTPRELASECARRRHGGGEAHALAHRAIDAVLERAERGVPMLWSRASHASYPRAFREETKATVRSINLPLWRFGARGLAADAITDDVIRHNAKRVWPEVESEALWGLVTRVRGCVEARLRAKDAVRRKRSRGAAFAASSAPRELGWYGAPPNALKSPRGDGASGAGSNVPRGGRRRSRDDDGAESAPPPPPPAPDASRQMQINLAAVYHQLHLQSIQAHSCAA